MTLKTLLHISTELLLLAVTSMLTCPLRCRFGLGVICWALEGPHGDPSKFDPYLEYIVSVRPRAVWFSFGNDLRRFVQRVRELESLREGGGPTTKIFIQVGTVKEALEVKQWPEVDVVVAQGGLCASHTCETFR